VCDSLFASGVHVSMAKVPQASAINSEAKPMSCITVKWKDSRFVGAFYTQESSALQHFVEMIL